MSNALRTVDMVEVVASKERDALKNVEQPKISYVPHDTPAEVLEYLEMVKEQEQDYEDKYLELSNRSTLANAGKGFVNMLSYVSRPVLVLTGIAKEPKRDVINEDGVKLGNGFFDKIEKSMSPKMWNINPKYEVLPGEKLIEDRQHRTVVHAYEFEGKLYNRKGEHINERGHAYLLPVKKMGYTVKGNVVTLDNTMTHEEYTLEVEKESKKNQTDNRLGIMGEERLEDSTLFQSKLWKKHSRKIKNEYAKQGITVDLYVVRKVEETKTFNAFKKYLEVRDKDTGKLLSKELI